MGHHLKIVCLGVSLLVTLSALSGVSHATPSAPAAAPPPAKGNPVLAVTLQSAQGRIATGAVFRVIAIGY
jgi:hypothetical protein